MSKQIIAFIEGVDMVGKTTITKALSEKLGILSYREERQDRWHDHAIDLLYSGEARFQMVKQLKLNVIFDREYPSEYAYSQAYGRETFVEKIFDYDKRYAELGSKIIYLYKRKGYQQKDETNLIELEKYDDIKKAYKDFLSKTKCEHLLLDTSDENLEEQLNTICKFLEK